MSGFMDGVPVKISEKYRPPPRTYQLPQVIEKQLELSNKHYNDAPQFCYDFQLERKVLAKIPEWRHMRQLKREARYERKEQREQQRLRDIEVQQKKLLCAVSYPSAEDLSSTSDSDGEAEMKQDIKDKVTNSNLDPIETLNVHKVISPAQTNSFHNILQPTILSPQSAATLLEKNANDGNTAISATTRKILSNFDDFEVITSSPFDNIELKTIDDLDVLAQVLKSARDLTIANTLEQPETKNTEENSNESAIEQNILQEAANLALIEHTKTALEKVNFNDLNDHFQENQPNENIPETLNNTSTTTIAEAMPAIVANSNALQTAAIDNHYAYQQQHNQLMTTYMPYSTQLHKNFVEKRQQQQQQHFSNYNLSHLAAYNNQNYLLNANGCNASTITPSYYSPTHFISPNANNYGNSNMHLMMDSVAATNFRSGDAYEQNSSLHNLPTLADSSVAATIMNSALDSDASHLKSKSVPDILKELSEEIHNSEMRRTRNYSDNFDDDIKKPNSENMRTASDEEMTPQSSPTKNSKVANSTTHYAKLEEPVKILAKNISSMGFPLERVAKIAQMFGPDDKKIIEHLIPLSELIDLGFDEGKISEALLKFSNNKEKALDYLIS